jgi:hypothetical protein
MSADLAGFLTVVGGVLDGDGVSWSIGGPTESALSLGGLLGEPQGISGYASCSQILVDLYLLYSGQVPQQIRIRCLTYQG